MPSAAASLRSRYNPCSPRSNPIQSFYIEMRYV